MGGEVALDEAPQLIGKVVVRHDVRPQHDKRLHGLATQRVGRTNDGGLGDRRVSDEDALDFERADSVPGAVDQVIIAAGEGDVPVRVLAGRVARKTA